MEQRVAAHAHHLRPIPVEESSGRLPYLRGMRYAAHADRAALALIFEHPAHSKEAHGKGRDELDIDRLLAAQCCAAVGQIEGNIVGDR